MKIEDALTAKRKNSADPIEADIVGSTECRARDRARGITVHSGSPVLAMCRALVGAGYDPHRPLHVYRGDTLALTVRTIGEGAKLAVSGSGVGFRWDTAEDWDQGRRLAKSGRG
jgi:hypothetical protein